MHKIIIVLAVAFAVLGSASPAMARPGVSDGGPADQSRYAQCFASTLTAIVTDSATITDGPERDRRIAGARGAADRACQPRLDLPKIPLSRTFDVPAGLAGTAIVSCDGTYQFSYRGTGYPYRAADPTITGATGIITGGPFPYTVSVQSTGPVGGYNDAYYWRVNNSTGATATLVMSINCQRPAGL
jgi:hypothetical protein